MQRVVSCVEKNPQIDKLRSNFFFIYFGAFYSLKSFSSESFEHLLSGIDALIGDFAPLKGGPERYLQLPIWLTRQTRLYAGMICRPGFLARGSEILFLRLSRVRRHAVEVKIVCVMCQISLFAAVGSEVDGSCLPRRTSMANT